LREALEWDNKRYIVLFARRGVLLLWREPSSPHRGGDFWTTCRHRLGVTAARKGESHEQPQRHENGPMTPADTTPVAGGLRCIPSDASLLSFVAAFVDTCGFVGLFQLFTAHVTGNFVLMGAALVNRQGEVWAKLLAFPAFILAVALTVVVADALRHRGQPRVGPLLWGEAALLVTAVVLSFLVGPPKGADDLRTFAVGMTMVLAMGLQNALMRLDLAALPPTTVMTGNVTQVTIDVMTLWREDGVRRDVARDRLRRMSGPVVAFLFGAAGGAGGYALLGFTSLLLPAVVCAVMARRFAHR
jgi:uncharacterized membrane protein YoaK (UPF0700 family)